MSVFETLSTDTTGYRVVYYPLECLYTPPLINGDFKGNNGYEELIQGYQNSRMKSYEGNVDLPIVKDEKDATKERSLSGMELFTAFVKGKTPYPFFWADTHHNNRHIRDLSKVIDDSHCVELCVGTGEKTADLMSRLRPQSLILNDIVVKNLEIARLALTKQRDEEGKKKPSSPIYPNKIRLVPGDITKEEFYKKLASTLTNLGKSKGISKRVLLISGATFNDFTPTQMGALLHNFRKLFDDMIIAIDNTTNPEALLRFYNHPKLFDLMLRGLTWHLGPHTSFRASAAECGIRVTEENDGSSIRLVIADPVNRIRYEADNSIIKPPISQIEQMARLNGLTVCNRMMIDDAICSSRTLPDPASAALINGTYGYWHFKRSL